MRIHTSLDRSDLEQAARVAGVEFIRLNEHRSNSHPRAFDVELSGSSTQRSQAGVGFYAATWDEWGIFLGRLFDRDEKIKAANYADAETFHWITGDRFRADGLQLIDQHRHHVWTSPNRKFTLSHAVNSVCDCGAFTRILSRAKRG